MFWHHHLSIEHPLWTLDLSLILPHLGLFLFLFHCPSAFMQLDIWSIMLVLGDRSEEFYPSIMTYFISSLSSHCFLNLKFFFVLVGLDRISASTWWWPEPHMRMYCTLECRNFHVNLHCLAQDLVDSVHIRWVSFQPMTNGSLYMKTQAYNNPKSFV